MGFGDERQKEQLESILNRSTRLSALGTDGKAQTIIENGERTVHLAGCSSGMSREEQLAMGITLGHEAYRNGLDNGKAGQFTETVNAVAGHTAMTLRMAGDSAYKDVVGGIVGKSQTLRDDIQMFMTGSSSAFAGYVNNMYDSSGDYWKLSWQGQLQSDGDGWLKDEDGKYINADGTHTEERQANTLGAELQESGLLNILHGTSGVAYSTFTDAEKALVQEMMTSTGLVMDKNGQWNTKKGKKINMTDFMNIAAADIAEPLFSAYYNNTADCSIAKTLGLNLGFEKDNLVPDALKDKYQNMVNERVSKFANMNSLAYSLYDKYKFNIKGSDGTSTELFKLTENNPFLDDILGQHDFAGINDTIDASGCNFMSTIAVPQLLTGQLFTAEQTQQIWTSASGETFTHWQTKETLPVVGSDATVNNPDILADLAWQFNNYDNLSNIFGGNYSYTIVAQKLQIPCLAYHYTLGSGNSTYYNPGYTSGKPISSVNIYLKNRR